MARKNVSLRYIPDRERLVNHDRKECQSFLADLALHLRRAALGEADIEKIQIDAAKAANSIINGMRELDAHVGREDAEQMEERVRNLETKLSKHRATVAKSIKVPRGDLQTRDAN